MSESNSTGMSATKALRVQLDNTQQEVQLLQVENDKLHSEEPLGDQPDIELIGRIEATITGKLGKGHKGRAGCR